MPHIMLGGGMKDLAAACTMCNDAEIGYSNGQYTRVGEPTEAALKVLVEKMVSRELFAERAQPLLLRGFSNMHVALPDVPRDCQTLHSPRQPSNQLTTTQSFVRPNGSS